MCTEWHFTLLGESWSALKAHASFITLLLHLQPYAKIPKNRFGNRNPDSHFAFVVFRLNADMILDSRRTNSETFWPCPYASLAKDLPKIDFN